MVCKSCGGRAKKSANNIKAEVEEISTRTTVRSWTALPLYNEAVLPDDLDLIGGSNELYQSWRIPVKLILPGGTLNPSTYTIPLNSTEVEVPKSQVVPVYIPNSLSAAEPAIAAAGQTATALAISKDDTNLVIQNSGFLKFSRPHMYEVGKTYYLSQENAGEVISVRPRAGIIQPLFSVVDQLTIAINIHLY